MNGPIKATIIKDEAVDMEIGSGVMTITPAHSSIDFEIAQRHDLDIEQVIDERGLLLPIAGEFEGQHIKKARPLILEKMKSQGLIEKIDENYTHNLATNSRGGGIIEPQIKEQWWVDVNKKIPERGDKSLKELMHESVSGGAINIIPDRFEKVYFNWIDNLRDWNISRQLWFGHRIPVWYKADETYVGIEAPEGANWEQDPDTLDTWFSSGLWSFSTLGWPDDTEDLRNYHPTSVMGPGYEIIFFWVARMILMSTFLLDEIPFRTVYLHGMLRDSQGRKFSKSLNNGIDPIDIIDKYGADALRISLIIGVGPGNDSKFEEQNVKSYKNFINKIWNISRFVLSNTEELDYSTKPKLSESDSADLEELNKLAEEVTEDMETYKLYLAAEKIYHYVWHTFADRIIEDSKEKLEGSDEESLSAQWTLYHILVTSLKLLHPFVPFVTEEIWQSMPQKERDILMISRWPNT